MIFTTQIYSLSGCVLNMPFCRVANILYYTHTSEEEISMPNLTSHEQAIAEQDDTVEIIDLGPHATASKNNQGERPQHDWRHSPKRRFLFYPITTICIVGLLTILSNLSSGFPSLIVDQVQKAFAQSSTAPSLSQYDEISCLTDTTRSPDSTVIAVLGFVKRCQQDDTAPGLVNLYDAKSHNLLTQFHPDNAIQQAVNSFQPGPLTHRLAISYARVTWSPDGKQLACTFIVIKHTALYGVVIIDRKSSHTRVLLQQQKPPTPFYATWDSNDSSSEFTI